MPDRRRSRAGPAAEVPTKPCASCGRTITWRKAWERDWDQVRYCSAGCRKRGVGPVDEQLERALLTLLEQRSSGATVCPSEAARAVSGSADDDEAWRPLMEPARAAARRLVAAGEVEITQRGVVVDPSTARGPIRVRRVRAG
jgi:hypothetical protein